MSNSSAQATDARIDGHRCYDGDPAPECANGPKHRCGGRLMAGKAR